jgi:serine/threonine protein kinase
VSESEEEGGLTRDGQIIGTGDYMAPEQVAKAKLADIRADIYGLGATLYQLLTGAPPLAGGTILQTYINRLQNEPPALSTLCSDVPPGLDAVLVKMLKRDPKDRYQTPDHVAADLASVLAGKPPEFAAPAVGSSTPSSQAADRLPIALEPGDLPVEFQLAMMARGSTSQFFDSPSESGLAEPNSIDPSGDASLAEFLDLLKTGSSDTSAHCERRRRNSAAPVRIGALAGQASRMIRKLVDQIARLKTSDPEQTTPQSAPRKRKRTKAKSRAPRRPTPGSSTPRR